MTAGISPPKKLWEERISRPREITGGSWIARILTRSLWRLPTTGIARR